MHNVDLYDMSVQIARRVPGDILMLVDQMFQMDLIAHETAFAESSQAILESRSTYDSSQRGPWPLFVQPPLLQRLCWPL